MEIKGRIKHLSGVDSGTSAAGNEWSRQNVVIDYVAGKREDGEKIVKQAVFQGMNKTVEYMSKLSEGDIVKITFNMEAREWEQKWYPSNSIFRIEKLEDPSKPEPKKEEPKPNEEEDDLPF